MSLFFNILIIYLMIISLIAVVVTIYDKVQAVRGKWRVKEKTLLLISALGGSVSMLVTMLIIRHKTKHIKFMLVIPAIILVQGVVAFLIWRFING